MGYTTGQRCRKGSLLPYKTIQLSNKHFGDELTGRNKLQGGQELLHLLLIFILQKQVGLVKSNYLGTVAVNATNFFFTP
jgi:hypothetical protein